jgi:hypothetical protein
MLEPGLGGTRFRRDNPAGAGAAAQRSDALAMPMLGSAPWLKAANVRLREIALLEPGWDGYGSAKPSARVIGAAVDLLKTLAVANFPAPHVVPVGGGAIQVEWHRDGRSLEIVVHAAGTVEYLEIENDSFDDAQNDVLAIEDLAHARSLARWLTQSSDE